MAKKKSNDIGSASGSTSFEKMGESIVDGVVGDIGARQSPNTISRPKKGPKGGGEPATAGHRKGNLERQGASLRPTTKLYEQNAPQASDTLKNTRPVKSSVGNRDFYTKRQYGQVQQ